MIFYDIDALKSNIVSSLKYINELKSINVEEIKSEDIKFLNEKYDYIDILDPEIKKALFTEFDNEIILKNIKNENNKYESLDKNDALNRILNGELKTKFENILDIIYNDLNELYKEKVE